MFVFEQCGMIRMYKFGNLFPQPFMDLTEDVRCVRGEEGLLGMAFSPNFKEDGYFYVNFSFGSGSYGDGDIRTVVRRYSISAENKNRGDPSFFETILEFAQPFSNHNAGDLAFGPDGYLYVATGDGGNSGDPQNNSQDKTSLLGKILRLDVSSKAKYAVPPDNPFVADARAMSEIWSYGVRNPWRMSFDMENGDLFFGDVGQNAFEEVNHQPAGIGGQNYGWRVMEARSCFDDSDSEVDCFDSSLTDPILAYQTRVDGCSVIGGYRYRGSEMPDMRGNYIYGDYCSGLIWYATQNPDDATWSSEILMETSLRISSFGENENGEIYVVDHDGSVYKMAVASTSCTDTQEFTFFDNPGKTCAWLLRRGKRKRRKLCRRTEIDGAKARNICPRACKARCQ